ncbi:FtsB family cell division protein [Luteococcus peritonei]|uniref:Septum formation initiator family protein n=1 Tax=Luteococcus peritonei TaxID=88874 RepID=A0ABW4RS98_9ACTN
MATKPSHNGPGRGNPRSRTVSRPRPNASRSSKAGDGERRGIRSQQALAPVATALSAPPRLMRGVGLTRRAIAFLVVVAILVLSYASSLRVYLRQEQDMATAQQQIVERTRANEELQREIERWKDADFVRTQARERLGWVMPGETGYRVVGPDGKPMGGGVTITSTSTVPEGEHATAWWDRLGGSIATADEPLVAEQDEPVLTAPADPDETPSATPKATPKR